MTNKTILKMLNIDKITSVSKPLPIDSSSIRAKISGTAQTKVIKTNERLPNKLVTINYPKTLTAKVSILKSNVKSLKSLNNSEKMVVIQNKLIGEITPKNVLKSFFLRKLVTVKNIYDNTSFFPDRRRPSTIKSSNLKNSFNKLPGKNKLIALLNPYFGSSITLSNPLKVNKFSNSDNSDNSNNSNNSNKKSIAQLAMEIINSPNRTKVITPLQKQNKMNKLGKLRRFTNLICKFNADVANYQSLYYHFKKSNKIVIQPFIAAAKILKLSFLCMGCLISKPVFKVVYTKNKLNSTDDFKIKARKKIIIQLFYYVKFKPSFLSLRKLIMKFISQPNILDPAYSFNSKMKRAERSKFLAELENKPQLKNTLRNIKRFERNKTFFSRYAYKFQFLASYLTKLLGGEHTELQLDLVRLHKPHLDSNILVQDLNLRSYKNRFYGLTKRLFRVVEIGKGTTKLVSKMNLNSQLDSELNNSQPLDSSSITGLHVKLGGRSFQQRIVPRRTVKQIQRGSLSRSKVKFIQKARFTGKVKRGSYSFTVTVGHAF